MDSGDKPTRSVLAEVFYSQLASQMVPRNTANYLSVLLADRFSGHGTYCGGKAQYVRIPSAVHASTGFSPDPARAQEFALDALTLTTEGSVLPPDFASPLECLSGMDTAGIPWKEAPSSLAVDAAQAAGDCILVTSAMFPGYITGAHARGGPSFAHYQRIGSLAYAQVAKAKGASDQGKILRGLSRSFGEARRKIAAALSAPAWNRAAQDPEQVPFWRIAA